MNFYISNGREREDTIFPELSSKFDKSCDTSKSSSDRKRNSKSNISVHSHTSVHSQPSVSTLSSVIIHKTFKTNSSIHATWRTTGKV